MKRPYVTRCCKYIITLFFLIFFFTPVLVGSYAFCANRSPSEKIDSLQKVLVKTSSDTGRIMVLNAIARQYTNKGDPDAAFHYADTALYLSGLHTFRAGRARSYFTLGSIYYSINGYDSALKYFNLSIAEGADNYSLARSLVMAGQLYRFQGKSEKSMQVYERSLTICKQIMDTAQLAFTLVNIAVLHGDSGAYQKAILLMKEALALQKQLNEPSGIANTCMNIGAMYKEFGDYTHALEYTLQSLAYFEKTGRKPDLANVHLNLGAIYSDLGNVPAAINELRKSEQLNLEINNPGGQSIAYLNMAMTYHDIGNYDSALYYGKLSLYRARQIRDVYSMAGIYNGLSSAYGSLGYLDSALIYADSSYKFSKESGNLPFVISSLMNRSAIFLRKSLPQKAKEYALEALALGREYNDLYSIKKAYLLLSGADSALNNFQGAYNYFKLYNAASDSLLNDQHKQRMAELSMQFALSQQQDSLAALQQRREAIARTEIARQKSIRTSVLAGSALILLFLLIAFRQFYQKRRAHFREEIAAVKLKALRAQMNPHFIFNSLNSIHGYIQKGDMQTASRYLLDFSKLTRGILEHSVHELILLSEEIEILQRYLELETMRLNKKVDFAINVSAELEPGSVLVPPMILQPFVENAIWHGILHKESNGRIQINISPEQGMLKCIIEDNGVGRVAAGKWKTSVVEKSTSMGISITKERLTILNKIWNTRAGVNLTDLFDEANQPSGTKVEVFLPLQTAI